MTSSKMMFSYHIMFLIFASLISRFVNISLKGVLFNNLTLTNQVQNALKAMVTMLPRRTNKVLFFRECSKCKMAMTA